MAAIRTPLQVFLGKAEKPVGKLVFVKDGPREFSQFAYSDEWLAAPQFSNSARKPRKTWPTFKAKAPHWVACVPSAPFLMQTAPWPWGKFPSVGDERAVTRGEVLALQLAQLAGIESAHARIVMVQGQPVAMIRRFDRTADQQRIPYISGATLLQANRDDEHAYTEIIDVMRSQCANFVEDARQLWRRLVFNHLITNVDDHLHNIGFLYAGQQQWRLAPAFDLNPFPDKAPESKTWLSEDSGPITSIAQLLAQAARFELSPSQAQAIVSQVQTALSHWKEVAASAEVGMHPTEMKHFQAAFRDS